MLTKQAPSFRQGQGTKQCERQSYLKSLPSLFLIFGDRVSLCSPSWSGTHYVAQVGYIHLLSARIVGMSHQTSSNSFRSQSLLE